MHSGYSLNGAMQCNNFIHQETRLSLSPIRRCIGGATYVDGENPLFELCQKGNA